MNHITIENVKIEKTCALSPMSNEASEIDKQAAFSALR